MRLLSVPRWTTEEIELSRGHLGVQTYAGRPTLSEFEILVPDNFLDEDEEMMETWNVLKYGPIPDLFDAMKKMQKIDVLEFAKDKVRLRGVWVRSMVRSATFNGRVFTCRADLLERLP